MGSSTYINSYKKITSIFQVIISVLPLFGVLFLNWNAFEMLVVYVFEGIIVCNFSTRKLNKIIEYKLRFNPNNNVAAKKSDFIWPIVIHLFFYAFLLMMGALAHAFHFQKLYLDFLPFYVNLSISAFFAPFIQTPELTGNLAVVLIGNYFLYKRFIKNENYKTPTNEDTESVFGRNTLMLFAIIVISFPIFWLTSLIGSVFELNSDRFVNILMAIVMTLVKNSVPIYNFFIQKSKKVTIRI